MKTKSRFKPKNPRPLKDKKNIGGTEVGKIKIFYLKFADDVVMLADTAKGLREMLKDLEKFSGEEIQLGWR